MSESLQFFYCVAVLAAAGAAAVRVLLPNGPTFTTDKAQLEVLAWMFSAGAMVVLAALILTGGGPVLS